MKYNLDNEEEFQKLNEEITEQTLIYGTCFISYTRNEYGEWFGEAIPLDKVRIETDE